MKISGSFGRRLFSGVLFSVIVLGITWLYTRNIGTYTASLFCDEAKIALLANAFLKGDRGFLNGWFFYQHYEYLLGSLPLFTTLPFIKIFGLTEFGTRVGPVFFGLLTLFIWGIWLKKNQWPLYGFFALVFTPLFFHASQINFGHTIGLCTLSLGYVCYLKAKSQNHLLSLPWKILFASLAGIFIAS